MTRKTTTRPGRVPFTDAETELVCVIPKLGPDRDADLLWMVPVTITMAVGVRKEGRDVVV